MSPARVGAGAAANRMTRTLRVWVWCGALSLGVACGASQGPRVEAAPPEWLRALHVGDTLVYHVSRRDQPDLVARVQIARVLRRGVGVAVLLWPDPHARRQLNVRPRWLAADDRGIHQVVGQDEVLDPQFVPLDLEGRFIGTSRVVEDPRMAGPVWTLPHDLRADQTALGGGWEVDELDFQVEGPIRGDRCARILRRDNEETRGIVVCANVGVVEVVVEQGEMNVTERWRLVEIARPVDSM